MLINSMCINPAVWVMVIGQKTKEVATINGMQLPDARLRFVSFFFSPSCHVKIDMKHACNECLLLKQSKLNRVPCSSLPHLI